jgi:hypothetical protein
VHQLGLHAVLRQRASLVGADGADRAERLDRWQPAHQRVLPDHAARAERQQHRHHRRQRLRDGGHRQAHGREDHEHRRLAAQHADHEDQRADRQHHEGQPLAEGGQALLQRRAQVDGAIQQAGHLAELGGHAGGHHQARSPAVRRRRALEGHVEPVAQRRCGFRQHARVLVDGDRLAGQCRFVDLQLGDLDQAQVGRHLVARLQQHDVAGHQPGCRHHLPLPGAQHGGAGCGELLQCCQRTIGAPGLHEADHCVEQHDHQDRQRVDQFTDHSRDHRGAEQHQDHEVLELVEQQRHGGAPCGTGDLVRAVLQRAQGGLGLVEPECRVDAVFAGQFVSFSQVPVGAHRGISTPCGPTDPASPA